VLKAFLSSRLIIVALVFLFLFCAGCLLYLKHVERENAREKARTDKIIERFQQRPAVMPSEAEPDNGAAVQHAALSQHKQPPGAVTTPVFPTPEKAEDPVTTAYKRLEYIQNNPYAWGGVFSPRATALIEELMPPPILRDEGHGEEVIELLSELIAQGDPRAANVLITTICEGSTAGWHMENAIVAIGPPSVPALLPYVREGNVWTEIVIILLGEIALQHRGDLGGIVDYILIPKFTHVAADEKYEKFDSSAVLEAREWLDKLE